MSEVYDKVEKQADSVFKAFVKKPWTFAVAIGFVIAVFFIGYMAGSAPAS